MYGTKVVQDEQLCLKMAPSECPLFGPLKLHQLIGAISVDRLMPTLRLMHTLNFRGPAYAACYAYKLNVRYNIAGTAVQRILCSRYWKPHKEKRQIYFCKWRLCIETQRNLAAYFEYAGFAFLLVYVTYLTFKN